MIFLNVIYTALNNIHIYKDKYAELSNMKCNWQVYTPISVTRNLNHT